MAFANTLEDEELLNQDPNQAPKLGPESAIITGQEMKPQGQQGGSGQYTNLQSYLNQPGVQEFGQEFSGKVANTVDEANTAQANSEKDFRTAAQKGYVEKDQTAVLRAHLYGD